MYSALKVSRSHAHYNDHRFAAFRFAYDVQAKLITKMLWYDSILCRRSNTHQFSLQVKTWQNKIITHRLLTVICCRLFIVFLIGQAWKLSFDCHEWKCIWTSSNSIRVMIMMKTTNISTAVTQCIKWLFFVILHHVHFHFISYAQSVLT